METIKGLTKEQTISTLKKYIKYNELPMNDNFTFVAEYVCSFILDRSDASYYDTDKFISYWVKKMYGISKQLPLKGFFGHKVNTENSLTRLAFVTLLIHELEKNK